MKRKFAIIIFVALISVTAFALAACDFLGGNDRGSGGNGGSGRFTVNANSRFDVPAGQDGPEIQFSHTDGEHNFWHFYMGKVENAPVVPVSDVSPAILFGGTTPITVEFTSVQISEQTIVQSHGTTVRNAVRRTNITQNTFSVGLELSIPIGPFSLGVETGFDRINTEIIESERHTTVTETFETVTHWRQENTTNLQATIGNHGEAPGFYRFALFATYDIYLVIGQCLESRNFTYEFFTFARPGTLFTALDFSETMSGFEDSALTNRLVFDGAMLENLPPPQQGSVVTHDFRHAADGAQIGELRIGESIRQAHIIGGGNTKLMTIVILPRTENLTLILQNVNIAAPQGRDGIEGARTGLRHRVTIDLIGDNYITGGDGLSGQNYRAASVDAYLESVTKELMNMPVRAGAGGDGINLGNNDLDVRGSGNLTATGGMGGVGGLWTANQPGSVVLAIHQGTVGGTGGRGIVAQNMSFFNAAGVINAIGGNGGVGGDGGFLYVTSNPDNTILLFNNAMTHGLPIPVPSDVINGADGGRGGDAVAAANLTEPIESTINRRGGAGGAGGNGREIRLGPQSILVSADGFRGDPGIPANI